MRIGVPKEIKNHEYRVGLTPASVAELVHAGHEVLVETKAGMGIDFDDSAYTAVGAKIAPDAASVFAGSDMIVKVKEPQPQEIAMLESRHLLFTYLHLAADKPQAEGLMKSGATCIAYETVTSNSGALPLLKPMSEVAGRMSIQVASHYLEKEQGGRGELLGGVPGVAPCKVAILGGGVSGINAAQMATGQRADVTIYDISNERLAELDMHFGSQIKTAYASKAAIAEAVKTSQVVIGAVLVPGAAAPKLVTKEFALGAWGYSQRQDDIIETDGAGDPIRRNARGAYVIAQKALGNQDGPFATSLFVRAGISDGKTSPYKGGWQAGVLATYVLPGRDDSQVSIGVNQAYLSKGYRDLLRGDGVHTAQAENAVEFTVSDKLTDFLTLQPDVQVIWNRGGDADAARVTMLTLRATLEF